MSIPKCDEHGVPFHDDEEVINAGDNWADDDENEIDQDTITMTSEKHSSPRG